MIYDSIQGVYDHTIRKFLPRKIKVYNGIPLNIGRILDVNTIRPDYKQGTVDPLRKYSECDDKVVIIGGGLGVSAVVAAKTPIMLSFMRGGGSEGQKVRKTARLNQVENSVEIQEAIVGDDYAIYGEGITNEHVSPSELPDCDILEMDCEGAEKSILESMNSSPRVIIVEAHPSFGVKPADIRSLLVQRGYEIVNRYDSQSGNVTYTGVRQT